MQYNRYNKNILETVTQGKVCGEPARSLDPFRLVKTTLFFILLTLNNSFCNDFLNEIYAGIDEFNKNKIITIEYTRQEPETAREAEVRVQKKQDEDEDVAKNKMEIRDGMYYVNAQWVSKDAPEKPVSKESLKDSDNDGYDDYTEYSHSTNYKDPSSIPAIRNGNNKKIFK
jgi:hypothetical protein